jgi:cytidylate kinase
VGRGSAYFLHDDPAAYHVFIYAPVEEKIRRERLAGRDGPTAARLVETVDGERAAFIWRYFGKVWPDPHLYHAMINSKIGDERVVDVILEGVAALPRA